MNFLKYTSTTSASKNLSMTFDDGPNGNPTLEVLGILKEYQIKATFFLIGKNIKNNESIVQKIVQEGHSIGNHSYAHENFLIFQSEDGIRSNLERTNKVVFDTTGIRPRYFRPPNGLMSPKLQRVCSDLRLTPVGAHIFVNDSFMIDSSQIAKRILSEIRNGSYIIVLHDGFGTFRSRSRLVVAGALKLILEKTISKLSYVTLDKFFETNKESLIS